MMSGMLRPLRLMAVAALGAGVLAGCGASGDGSAGPSDGTTPSGSTPPASASTSAAPSATASYTAQGTKLALGQKATVEWSPKQTVKGVLAITVTQLQSTSYQQTFSGWNLPADTKTKAPYFVRATVTNAGTTDLGGYAVPLYGVDDAHNLLEASTFGSAFTPCQPGSLPKRFAPGASVKVCLVYLVPDRGRLAGVSFRPAEDYDPVTWTGKVQRYTLPKPGKHGRGGTTG